MRRTLRFACYRAAQEADRVQEGIESTFQHGEEGRQTKEDSAVAVISIYFPVSRAPALRTASFRAPVHARRTENREARNHLIIKAAVPSSYIRVVHGGPRACRGGLALSDASRLPSSEHTL